MKTFLLFILSAALFSCNIEPQPFSYGKDNCHFCKMTIMEPKFATQIVTQKGKVFKFDDASCMVKFMNAEGTDVDAHAHVVVNDYQTNKFLNATDAHFVHSPDYRSPMAGNVAAFTQKPAASTGTSLTWQEVKSKF